MCFNKNKFTDVITFNLEEEGKLIEGEIYISFERIKENATLYKQEIEEEFERIIIHGLLHLLGYKDKTKNEKEIGTLESKADALAKWNDLLEKGAITQEEYDKAKRDLLG